MDMLDKQTLKKDSGIDTASYKKDLIDKCSQLTGISVSASIYKTEDFPPKPVEPLPEDCCSQGCKPCIFDIYQQQLAAWETECQRLEKADLNLAVGSVLSNVSWSRFCCTSVDNVATNVNIYKFVSTDCKKELKLKPGQYLVAQSNLNCTVTRAYTPLPNEEDVHFSVLVKLYDDGLMSASWKNLQLGDMMLWKGPYETGLSYSPNSYKQLVMFCAGTGIAPCFSLAHHITRDELDETFVRLVFSCRTRHDMLLRQGLHHLTENWNFTCRTIITQDDCVGLKRWYGEDVSSGRITSDLVSSELNGKTDSIYVIICGTQSFNKDVCGYVIKSGVLDKNIKVL